MSLLLANDKNIKEYLPQILEIEANARYPLGNDYFRLDHGRDYFAFFNRLGKVKYYIWKEGTRVAAVVCGVLRQTPPGLNKKAGSAWYICDLKVHPAFRGKRIPLKIMSRILLPNYFRCGRGYAISMNSSDITENRVVKLMKNFRWAPIDNVTQIVLWSLDENRMEKAQPILERHRGQVRYLSLRGVKDIMLESTQTPLPILHAQFGPLADVSAANKRDADAIHMFCAPAQDPMTSELQVMGFEPSSSASIISHRMHASDWKWILTSDI